MDSYLSWHYGTGWKNVVALWKNIGIFPLYFFCVPTHLENLFSPWKRQRVTSKKPGFHPSEMLFSWSFNVTSRLIGAMMRLVLICAGTGLSILLWTLGGIGLLLWLIIPGIGWQWYLHQTKSDPEQAQLLLSEAKQQLNQLAIGILSHPYGEWLSERLGYNPATLSAAIQKSSDPGDWSAFTQRLQTAAMTTTPTLNTVITACWLSFPLFQKIFTDQQLDDHDLATLLDWHDHTLKQSSWAMLWDVKAMEQVPGIGADWTYGYTVEFDRFARDITRTPAPYPLLIGREKELEAIEQILVKTEGNNALVIGEPGVDRHVLIITLANRMAAGKCLAPLSHKRILLIDMHAIVAAQHDPDQVKAFLTSLLEEAAGAGNIIVCIDELDRYVTSENNRLDLTDVWEKLAHSAIAFISITTPDAYHRYIEPNTTITRLFETITVEPPTPDTVMTQLQQAIVPILEQKYGLWITYQTLKKIIADSQQYLSNTPFPASAIDLLDQTCVSLTTAHKEGSGAPAGRTVLPRHVDDVLSRRYHITIGDVQQAEKEKLQRLEALLHQRLIGQELAVTTIASSLRRARLHLTSANRPIGSFLFLGPTGVGKTEAAKTLSEVYFGSEDRILRFDMSEFQKEEGIRRLIGSVDTNQPGELTSKLRSNPISLLLFDEFEKADKEIFNLFLPLLDEGYISDAYGKKVDAKNSFIIATSNAGAEFIRESLEAQMPQEQLHAALLEKLQRENVFSPEFLNRFDAVVVFTPLDPDQIKAVAKEMLESLNKHLAQQKDHVSVAITDGLLTMLVAGYDPQFGARGIRRIITEKVEDQIAQQLLSGATKPGSVITIV